MRLNRMNALAACCHFSIFIGSFLCQRAKPPHGTVLFLFINLLGKGLTPRACVGDGGSIWWAPGWGHCWSKKLLVTTQFSAITRFIFAKVDMPKKSAKKKISDELKGAAAAASVPPPTKSAFGFVSWNTECLLIIKALSSEQNVHAVFFS